MTREDRDRIGNLDRQWDRFLDNQADSTGQDEELERIAGLHGRDDAPAPSADFRNRLDAELRAMHPAGNGGIPAGRGFDDDDDATDDTPHAAIGAQRRGPVSINRPGTLRDWGELATMLVILVLALLGASLYGDDAYDFAQRQLASEEEESESTGDDDRDGLTFEEAQQRSPFEMVMPSFVPEGLSLAWADASFPRQFASDIGEWETAHAELVFETGDAGLPEVGIRFTPSSFQSAAPAWNVEEVIDVQGTGVLRALRPGGVHSQYFWRQGDIYVSVSALINPDAAPGDSWPDEIPYTSAEIERMVESIIEQGPLESQDDQIQSQNVTLDGVSESMSADPLIPDPIPESLQLQQSNAWMDGLEMIFGHESDERVGEIALMQSWLPGSDSRSRFEALHEAGGESIDVGDMSVTRHVLPDWTGREAVDYLSAVGGPRPRVLPLWLPRNVETGLVTYIWDIGDSRFTLGVEVSPDLIEVDEGAGARLVDGAPEEDWLALAPATVDAWDRNEEPSEERKALDDVTDALAEDGEVVGLAFEDAQALTPFEMASPSELPDGLSAGEYAVSVNSYERRIGEYQWNLWQGEASFEVPGEGLDPLRLSMQPAGEHLTFPVSPAVEGEDVPNGHLDVVQINGTGVFRSVSFSGNGEVHTSYLWQQGDVDLLVEAPFGVDMTDEQREWVESTDAPFGNDDVERMIASLIDQGPLAVENDEIAHRGLTLARARDWLPTAPYPDVIPEQLELLEPRIRVNGNGPSMVYRHASNDAIGDIRMRAFAGYHHPRLRERIQDAGGETFDHNGIAVSRRVLTEPTAPEISDYIIGLGRFPDLLLPWMEDGSDSALATYTWGVSGMGFMMSVEVPRDYLETNADGNTVLSSEVPEADWLTLIDAQRRTAEEHLRPEQHFSVLDREPTPEDELPQDSDWEATHGDPDQTRLLSETETSRYYMLVYDNREVCVRQVNIEREQLGGGGCSPLWSAADTGVVFGSGGTDVPTVRVAILPDGYEEVVDEDGEIIAEVENNVFVIEVESGESRPSGLIARGPAGELPVGLP